MLLVWEGRVQQGDARVRFQGRIVYGNWLLGIRVPHTESMGMTADRDESAMLATPPADS